MRIRASHLPYHALQCYIPLSLTNCHSSCFLFLFLVCFLMNELLLSYLLYPFAQLARAENTIIFFRLPFGWFFMKTFFLQFVCLFVCFARIVCVQCMQNYEELMHCMCKSCRDQEIFQKSGSHEAPPKPVWYFPLCPISSAPVPLSPPVVKFGNLVIISARQ